MIHHVHSRVSARRGPRRLSCPVSRQGKSRENGVDSFHQGIDAKQIVRFCDPFCLDKLIN
jgi:hypothetical protein